MKCFNLDYIQRYLDKELTAEEIKKFEQHLSGCTFCNGELNDRAENIALIRSELSILEPEEIIVPVNPFSTAYTDNRMNAGNSRKVFFRRMTLLAAAAILVAIFISQIDYLNRVEDYDYMEAIMKAEEDILIPDSNTWWTEKRMFIAIIDEENKTMEKIITSKNAENIISETIKY